MDVGYTTFLRYETCGSYLASCVEYALNTQSLVAQVQVTIGVKSVETTNINVRFGAGYCYSSAIIVKRKCTFSKKVAITALRSDAYVSS